MRKDIYERLLQAARAQETITYGELNDELKLGLDFLHRPTDRKIIGDWLDEISIYEVEGGRRMLSALVYRNRYTNMRIPSKRFLRLARKLGLYSGEDASTFWRNEINLVHECWKDQ